MTGPYGYFVTRVLHIKRTSKTFLGQDASTNSFMTPARYNNYHAITVLGKETNPVTIPTILQARCVRTGTSLPLQRSCPK